MKFVLILLITVISLMNCAMAESLCDIRPGTSLGLRVVEFATGNVVHSKMPMNGSTADALYEEMVNLQEMGVCEEKFVAKKCVLRFEKHPKASLLIFFRGEDRWVSWLSNYKKQAQDFIKNLKKTGFCL